MGGLEVSAAPVARPWTEIALTLFEPPLENADMANERAEKARVAQAIAITSTELTWKPTFVARLIPRSVDVPRYSFDPERFVQSIVVAMTGPDETAIAQGLTLARGLTPETGSGADVVYEVSEVDRPPLPIFRISPRLDRKLESDMAGQSVHARFIVTKDGRVDDIRIVKCPQAAAVGPTTVALEQWQFLAARKRGRFVNVRVRQELRFSGRSPFER